MNKQFNYLLAIVAIVFMASSCASLTGFEEGRSLGEDNSESIVSINFTKAPNLFEEIEEPAIDTLNTSVTFPNLEFSYKRGITDQLDVGGRISTNLNASTYLKYQVVGDKSSSFAFSPGLEFGTVLGSAYNVGIPLYASFYPTESVTVNVTPRFMYQFITGLETAGATYLGGNFGLLFGRKHKFGLDVGYYNVSTDGNSNALLTFGIGGKFRFGDSD